MLWNEHTDDNKAGLVENRCLQLWMTHTAVLSAQDHEGLLTTPITHEPTQHTRLLDARAHSKASTFLRIPVYEKLRDINARAAILPWPRSGCRTVRPGCERSPSWCSAVCVWCWKDAVCVPLQLMRLWDLLHTRL